MRRPTKRLPSPLKMKPTKGFMDGDLVTIDGMYQDYRGNPVLNGKSTVTGLPIKRLYGLKVFKVVFVYG